MPPRSALRVSEIFESLQGEGPSAGCPSVFLRLGNCNLRCTWCDTKYTWDWSRFKYEDEVRSMPIREVAHRLGGTPLRRLVVTGGEPLLQRRELATLFGFLPEDFHVEVETNGTLLPGLELSTRVDQWNVSPKLANCGEPGRRRIVPSALAAFRDTGRAYLKVVVESLTDAAEIDALIRQLDWPRDRALVMAQASTRSALVRREPLARAVAERLGVATSPRLHVLHWNGARGT